MLSSSGTLVICLSVLLTHARPYPPVQNDIPEDHQSIFPHGDIEYTYTDQQSKQKLKPMVEQAEQIAKESGLTKSQGAPELSYKPDPTRVVEGHNPMELKYQKGVNEADSSFHPPGQVRSQMIMDPDSSAVKAYERPGDAFLHEIGHVADKRQHENSHPDAGDHLEPLPGHTVPTPAPYKQKVTGPFDPQSNQLYPTTRSNLTHEGKYTHKDGTDVQRNQQMSAGDMASFQNTYKEELARDRPTTPPAPKKPIKFTLGGNSSDSDKSGLPIAERRGSASPPPSRTHPAPVGNALGYLPSVAAHTIPASQLPKSRPATTPAVVEGTAAKVVAKPTAVSPTVSKVKIPTKPLV